MVVCDAGHRSYQGVCRRIFLSKLEYFSTALWGIGEEHAVALRVTRVGIVSLGVYKTEQHFHDHLTSGWDILKLGSAKDRHSLKLLVFCRAGYA